MIGSGGIEGIEILQTRVHCSLRPGAAASSLPLAADCRKMTGSPWLRMITHGAGQPDARRWKLMVTIGEDVFHEDVDVDVIDVFWLPRHCGLLGLSARSCIKFIPICGEES